MPTIDLLLVGFGNVARRFVRLVHERRERLADRHGLVLRVAGLCTAHHGRRLAPAGLDLEAVADLAARAPWGEDVGPRGRGTTRAWIAAALRHPAIARRARRGRVVVVETTTLDIVRGQPAIDHVAAALSAGAHVVTANKGPAAFAYRRLSALAARARRQWLFEGAVMDGVPVFSLVRETLPDVDVVGFRGVVNSTTNYILTAMERGRSFEQALAAMQAAGIAESDASLDVEGWDAAAKAAILANVLLDADITPRDVQREGLAGATKTRVDAARVAGRRMKLVASAERTGHGVRARVAPVELAGSDLLAGLEGEQNALVLQTDLLGEIAIVQRGAGLAQTAFALYADIVTIARGLTPAAAPRSPRTARPGRTP